MAIPVDSATLFFNEQKMLSFCSHDYLGLSDHTELKKNAIKFLLQYGLCGTSYADPDFCLNHQKQLEDKFAHLVGKETAFFFSIPPDLSVLLDETKFLKTESISSLSGHFSDLKSQGLLAKKNNALFCIDDSHSFAVFGKDGMGLSSYADGVDLITGAFDKGGGVFGYYLACNQKLADSLHINKQLLPSPLLGALDTVFELIPQMEGERKQLQQRAHFLREQLQEIGFAPIPSLSPLIALPFKLKDEAEALRKSLLDAHIFIAPPKQHDQVYLLQVILTSTHMPDHLALLIKEIKALNRLLERNLAPLLKTY